MNRGLVSICIPTYNGALYLQEALDSIKVQTYQHLEIIVSDDASVDKTLNIIEDFKRQIDCPIHIYHHEPSGIGANWNNCLKYANGEYIKFLFQDDTLNPQCIEEMVSILDLDSTIDLVASKRTFIVDDANNQGLDLKKWVDTYGDLQAHLKLEYHPIAVLNKSFFKSPLFYRGPINIVGEPSAVMFRKKIIKAIGVFRTDLKQNLDIEYWFRILKHSSIGILNKPLIKFRIHPLQATQQNKTKVYKDSIILSQLLYEDYFWLLNRYRQKQLFLKHNQIGKLICKFFR